MVLGFLMGRNGGRKEEMFLAEGITMSKTMEVAMVMERDLTWGGEHRKQYTDDVL